MSLISRFSVLSIMNYFRRLYVAKPKYMRFSCSSQTEVPELNPKISKVATPRQQSPAQRSPRNVFLFLPSQSNDLPAAWNDPLVPISCWRHRLMRHENESTWRMRRHGVSGFIRSRQFFPWPHDPAGVPKGLARVLIYCYY